MKKCILATLLLCLLLPTMVQAEETRSSLRLGGTIYETDYWQAKHIATLRPNYGWDDYQTIAKSTNAPDLSMFLTRRDDFLAVKQAGLLSDLSGSAVVQAWINRLRPDIKRLVTTDDGKILGVPWFATFEPMYWRQDAWNAAGFTQEDVPQSYTELLDFVEKWIERITEQPEKQLCVANTANGYQSWLLNLLIHTWEMQQYHAGEALNFNTSEFVALLQRTQEIALRLDAAEPSGKAQRMPLFEDDSGGERYNAGREYGLSHTIPFRITKAQPELMRGTAMIYVVRAESLWRDEILAYLEYDLTEGSISGGKNADLLTNVQPRKQDPKDADASSTVTAGYLSDLDGYTGTVCFAPMLTTEMYEGALSKFMAGTLSAQELAAQMSIPKRSPND